LKGFWSRVDTDATRTFIQEATEAMEGAEDRGYLFSAAGRTLDFWEQRTKRIEIGEGNGITSLTVAVANRKNLQLAVRHDERPDLPGAGDHNTTHFCQTEGMGTESLCTFEKPEPGVWYISVFSFDFENSYDLRIWVTRDEKKADGPFGGVRVLDDEEEPVAAGCATAADRPGTVGWLALFGLCLLGLRTRQ
jgi:MYXO-CTERM domain-containing protein